MPIVRADRAVCKSDDPEIGWMNPQDQLLFVPRSRVRNRRALFVRRAYFTKVAPDCSRTSGIRKSPPISTNSPRETITSPSLARAESTSSAAAAQLLTTSASSASASSASSFRPIRRDDRVLRFQDRIRDCNIRRHARIASAPLVSGAGDLRGSYARSRL